MRRGRTMCCRLAAQARFRGGLSVLDFVKVITVQQLSERRIAAARTQRSNVSRGRKGCQRTQIRFA